MNQESTLAKFEAAVQRSLPAPCRLFFEAGEARALENAKVLDLLPGDHEPYRLSFDLERLLIFVLTPEIFSPEHRARYVPIATFRKEALTAACLAVDCDEPLLPVYFYDTGEVFARCFDSFAEFRRALIADGIQLAPSLAPKVGQVQAAVLRLFQTHYELSLDTASALATDPNTFDVDPGPFYQDVAATFGPVGDKTDSAFEGMGGTLADLVAFITPRWDGRFRK